MIWCTQSGQWKFCKITINLQIFHPMVHKDKFAKEYPKRQFPKKGIPNQNLQKNCLEEITAEFTEINSWPTICKKKLSKSKWRIPKSCPKQQVAKILIYEKDKCVICTVVVSICGTQSRLKPLDFRAQHSLFYAD